MMNFFIFYRYSNDIYGNDKDKHGTSTPSLYLGHLWSRTLAMLEEKYDYDDVYYHY